jgi:conjugation system TraG family ATPase
LLLALWKKDNESFSRSEYITLSNAVQCYYETNTGLQSFNSFYLFLQTRFADRLEREKIREKDFDLASLLYVLKPYAKGGEFDFLLNAQEQLDLLHQPLVVFELDNIKDHPVLFPVVTLIIMESFIAKMRKLKGVRKVMLIEEAWKAIARQGMAEYIRYLFKTVRKFFGEAIVVTQDIDDIVGSKIVKDAIINNSDCKILLDQSKYLHRFQQLQELLGLSDKEKTLVLSLNKANDPSRKYKEVFVSLGGTLAKVYGLELSIEEYLAYTTEEQEKVRVRAYADRFGSMQEGIKQLVKQLREQNGTI